GSLSPGSGVNNTSGNYNTNYNPNGSHTANNTGNNYNSNNGSSYYNPSNSGNQGNYNNPGSGNYNNPNGYNNGQYYPANNSGTFSLVFGILSIVCSLTFVLAIGGLVFGPLAIVKGNQSRNGNGTAGKIMGIIGVSLSGVVIAFYLIFYVLVRSMTTKYWF
ncbi:MAG: DUF4190 domain-containing protein, partial [Bacillota bacterium]|nr:DUF4190 domain-containing protein [Bacillota bacterium]